MIKNRYIFVIIIIIQTQGILGSYQEAPTPPVQRYVPHFNSTGSVSLQLPNGTLKRFDNYQLAQKATDYAYKKAVADYKRQKAAYNSLHPSNY